MATETILRCIPWFIAVQMSRVVRSESKDADQLRSNCAADQRLCYRYTDSTIPVLSESKISSPVCVRPGRKPQRPVFSQRGSDYLSICKFGHLTYSLRGQYFRHYCASSWSFLLFFSLIQFNVPFNIISLIETSQSIGGANHLTHPQAELVLSHMWPVPGSNLHQTQR